MRNKSSAQLQSRYLAQSHQHHLHHLHQLNAFQNGVDKEARSLPIHCIVESATGSDGPPSSAGGADHASGGTARNSSGKASGEPTVELDTYAIVSGFSLFSELVRSALLKLGYTAAEAVGAKGALQIRNWKPLTFDSITQNPDSTVDQILGDMTNIITLRIRLRSSRSKLNSVEEVKEKLLSFLLQHSQAALSSLGCPIEKNVLAQISKGEPGGLSEELRRSFDRWYAEQTRLQRSSSPSPPPLSSPQFATMALGNVNVNVKTETCSPAHAAAASSAPISLISSANLSVAAVPASYSDVYPAIRNELCTMRSRVRTSFDPEHEIPRLHRWFQQTQHPTRDQMLTYLAELNSLEFRRRSKPLDLTNIIYWFKNARAAHRRASRDMDGSVDENDDERLSPNAAADVFSVVPRSTVPELPNSNAVYVVNPMVNPMVGTGSSHDVVSVQPQEPRRDDIDDNKNDVRVHDREGTSQQERGEPNRSPASENELNGELLIAEDEGGRNVYRDKNDNQIIKSEDSDSSSCSSGNSQAVYRSSVPSGNHLLGHSPIAYMHPATAHALYRGLEGSPMLGNPNAPSFEGIPTSEESRRKRSRVFIDPLSEIPKLEIWFKEDTHPSSYMVEKFTEELNRSEYRQRFPRLEPKNIQLWFKNHRAKVKRIKIGESALGSPSQIPLNGSNMS